MEAFFDPKSVAILGVSVSPSNLARVTVENMNRFAFQGTLYLVGEKGGSLAGKDIYTSVEHLPEIPDLAVLLIPALAIPEALEACGRKGIRRIVIQTGGFSEFGEDRKSLEQEILRIAALWGQKIVGPNCVGTVNVENGLTLPFYPLAADEAKTGSVSIISQSGGLIHDLMVLCNMENLGVGKLVSVGNKLMLDENDFLEYLVSDPLSKVLGLYLEDIKDGRRFMEIAWRADKPIVLVKANRSTESMEVARFHTTALAGDDEVVDAAARQAGVIRTDSIKEMVDCFKAFSLPPLRGRRLAVMTRSGGHAVLAADCVQRFGFDLAHLSENVFDAVRQGGKAGVIRTTNPLDLGDVFDIGTHGLVAERALREENVDGLLFIHSYAAIADPEPTRTFLGVLAGLSRQIGKPVILCMTGHKSDWFSMRDVAGFPVFTHVDEALKAFSRACDYFRRNGTTGVRRGPAAGFTAQEAPAFRLPEGMLPVKDTFSLLTSRGLVVADWRIVRTVDEGLAAGGAIGYPVALKDATPDSLHKTETGGVNLGIRGPSGMRAAFDFVRSEAVLYLVQKMANAGCEVIIGGRRDPQFGPVVLCGLGGIFVEVYRDVSIRVAPVTEEEAMEMIDRLKGVPILKGLRGRGPYDLHYFAGVIKGVSELLTEHPEIGALDINPMILHTAGRGGVVVDAKIRVT